MKCPRCGKDNNRAYNSKSVGGSVVRWRECFSCGAKYRTVEMYGKRRQKKGVVRFVGEYGKTP